MSENATHVEGLEFHAKDVNASATADKITQSLSRLNHVADDAKEKVGGYIRNMVAGAAASVGLGLGLHALYEKAKHANMEIERVRKAVAGAQFAFQGWKPGITQIDKMGHSMRQATAIGEELEEMEIRLNAPLEEISSTFTQAAAIGYGKLGMNQQEVLDLTEKITAASKVYGVSSSEAIMTVTRAMMTGKIRGFGPFQQAMRDVLDVKATGKQKGPVDAAEMYKKLEQHLKGMVPVAQKMGGTFEGNMRKASAIIDKMVEALGGPLFREQSAALANWVAKLRDAKVEGENLMKVYGEKIATVFKFLKDTTISILDHWKLIGASIVAAKGSALMLGAASAMGGVGGATGSLIGVGELWRGRMARDAMGAQLADPRNFSTRLQAATGGLANFTGKLMAAAPALTMLYIGLEKAADWLNTSHERNMAEAGKLNIEAFSAVSGVKGRAGERAMQGYLTMTGLGGAAGADRAAVAKAFAAMDEGQREVWAKRMGSQITEQVVTMGGPGIAHAMERVILLTDPEALAKKFGEAVGQQLLLAPESIRRTDVAGNMFTWGKGDPNVRKQIPKNPDINIHNLTITQDFKEADPDRVFHRVTNEISGLVNNPNSSRFQNRVGM